MASMWNKDGTLKKQMPMSTDRTDLHASAPANPVTWGVDASPSAVRPGPKMKPILAPADMEAQIRASRSAVTAGHKSQHPCDGTSFQHGSRAHDTTFKPTSTDIFTPAPALEGYRPQSAQSHQYRRDFHGHMVLHGYMPTSGHAHVDPAHASTTSLSHPERWCDSPDHPNFHVKGFPKIRPETLQALSGHEARALIVNEQGPIPGPPNPDADGAHHVHHMSVTKRKDIEGSHLFASTGPRDSFMARKGHVMSDMKRRDFGGHDIFHQKLDVAHRAEEMSPATRRRHERHPGRLRDERGHGIFGEQKEDWIAETRPRADGTKYFAERSAVIDSFEAEMRAAATKTAPAGRRTPGGNSTFLFG